MPLDRAFERLRATGFLTPLAPRPPPSILPPRFRTHEFCAFHQMVGHRTDYCASLRHTIQDLIDSGAVSFPVSTTDTDLDSDMTVDSFPAYSTHAVHPPSEHLETRLLQLRFTMSDEITPITLTALYEMMVDLTRWVERIELILSEHPSSSRGAPRVTMPSLPRLTPSMFAALGASHPRPRPYSMFQQHSSSISLATPTRLPSRLQGPPVITVPQERFHPRRRCQRRFSDLSTPLSRVFETFQAMGFLAPLAPGHFQILCLHSFGLTCIVRTISQQDITLIVALLYDMPYRTLLILGRLGILSPIYFLFLPQLRPFFVPSVARDVMTGPVTVECEEFEPRVDLAWRELAYDLWVVYDVRIDRLLDETVTYFIQVKNEKSYEESWAKLGSHLPRVNPDCKEKKQRESAIKHILDDSRSQQSNASNGVQFGVETKKLQPLQANHSELKEAFCKVLRNHPFVAK
ncbi:hypothetical protein CK203_020244 [Vitis vinifera]|uniref:Uncharacterized protein n=1 Tax=Vitis vinifera TaxID=29760 RepID=A0A438J883_VITVI|nr:hypothetical protein CK203_020244 [Vitis vinifera]